MAVFHVCVCSFPSILVTVPRRIKARRVLHFAVYSGDYTFAAYFSVLLNQPGSHRKGVNTGAFSSFYFSSLPHPLFCGTCLHFLSRGGFRRPFPSSTVKSNSVYSRSFSAPTAFHYLPYATSIHGWPFLACIVDLKKKTCIIYNWEKVSIMGQGLRTLSRPRGEPRRCACHGMAWLCTSKESHQVFQDGKQKSLWSCVPPLIWL